MTRCLRGCAERGRYWQAAVEPFWPRLRALSTADLTYHMEQFADGGLAASRPTCIRGGAGRRPAAG